MVRDDLSNKLKGEAKRLQDKQRLVDELHKHYSKYGNTVVAMISEHALKKGGIRPLLRKLSLHIPHDAQRQHNVLTQFLRLHGQKEFLERTGAAKASESREPAADEFPLGERRSGLERRSGASRRKRVDLITTKNRRFGRDRRSGKERRKKPPFVAKNQPCWKPTKKK